MFANGNFKLRLYVFYPALLVLIIYIGMHYIFVKYIVGFYIVLWKA